MNKVYTNKDFTKHLSEKVSQNLTLKDLAGFISSVVTDPHVDHELRRVIGEKGESKLNRRKATAFVAKILGYENEHVMASKTENMKFYTLLHTHEYDYTSYVIATDGEMSGIHPEVIDDYLSESIKDLDFEPDRNESLELFEMAECNALVANKNIPFIPSKIKYKSTTEKASLEIEIPISMTMGSQRSELEKAIAEQLRSKYGITQTRDLEVKKYPASHKDGLTIYFGGKISEFEVAEK